MSNVLLGDLQILDNGHSRAEALAWRDRKILCVYRCGAEASGCLDTCGTLEPGKRADIVVLSGPLREVADLDNLSVAATIVGGRLVHGALPEISEVST
jgi:predicted amidohydrolase YtcJ